MAALKPKGERKAFDLYETPEWAVDALLSIVPIRKDWTYMEPCRASGRFYNHMPIGSAWGEIREGVDYLATEYNRVDCIITNPPYSLAQEFVEKAHKDADVVIMLLRAGFLGSMKRFDFWGEYPVDHLITLSKRPSFTDDGKTDGAEYCYFIWDPKGRLELESPFYWAKPKS
ncbi:N-6-adenine-methyltransferase [Salmonella phage SSBI34]|nr:N-6-adenine-methyltransferase [Salmonella phage SSBI34]